jgi:hypothetical protein
LVAKAIPSKTDADSAGSANADGLQVVITKKMRRVLVDELMYTEDEVDNLDPQVSGYSLSTPQYGVRTRLIRCGTSDCGGSHRTKAGASEKGCPRLVAEIVFERTTVAATSR